jgi:D-alanyl-lipoteichoic acid acyltransferase DltB (MBOAT superfamily)
MTSTIITYLSGIYLEKSSEIENVNKRERLKKWYVGISFSSNLAILFFYKYFNFLNESILTLSTKLGIEWNVSNFDVLLPVGISFYTFQALSYTMDVYRGDLKAEKHFGKYALFVSFFPQLVAGPIERSTNLLPQFNEKHYFDYDRVKRGLLLMLWGFFKKIVIADRLAILVNTVYNNPTNYQGIPLIIATIFFAFQIYCDFSSYSDIAIGSANIMGYNLMNNFERPYFSKSIAEFWKRWHISLGTWFKDYLYIPLGGSRVSKVKRYRNIMVVFMVSGLWHGASWNFVIWGALHGIYQLIGSELKPLRDVVIKKLNIDIDSITHKWYRMIITFILVDFAWIFFRSNSFKDSIYIIQNIFKVNLSQLAKISIIGLDKKDLLVAILSLIILLLINLLQRNTDLITELSKKRIYVRWTVYYFFIFYLIIFGKFNSVAEFIYFQF